MKITVVGGGGSRTPLLYHGVVQRMGDLPGVELMLHDTSAPWLARVRKVIGGIDEALGVGVPTTTTTDLDVALDSADFVLTAIRAGGFDARRSDEAVPLAHGVVGQETVGPGGFGLALRNIPALADIARVMRRRCPDAWLVNLANPAGMATEGLGQQLGDRVIGVCDSPVALMRGVADALSEDPGELHFDYGGLNHLGWLTGVWRRGRDLLPGLIESPRLEVVDEVRLIGADRVRALGAVPNEYLYFYERTADVLANVSGNESRGAFLAGHRRDLAAALDEATTPPAALAAYRASLRQRQDTYLVTESGMVARSSDDVFADAGGYHEMALSVVQAIACDRPTVVVVNTRNRGALSFLPDDVVVEVPAVVHAAGAFPLAADVPAARRQLVERVKAFEQATLRAITSRSRREAAAALATHPLVPTQSAADAIVAQYAARMPLVSALLRAS